MPLFRRHFLVVTALLAAAHTLAAQTPSGPAAKPTPTPPPLPAATRSAWDTSRDGWINLLADGNLSAWQRGPYAAGKPLGARDVWSLDAATGVLRCDATGVHENLLHRTVRGDGIFHCEFRFTGASAKPNSGAYVRTRLDATVWFQAQLAPSGLGLLFGAEETDAKPRRLMAGGRYPELMRPAGEWNVIEVTCHGSELVLWVNGYVTARATVSTLEGLVGLEAELNPVEFRQVLFKPAAPTKP